MGAILTFVVFFLLLFLYLTQDTHEKSLPPSAAPRNQIVNKISPGSPLRLTIPAINVNAGIQHVGITPKGEMGVPSNTLDVGWFDLGPRPGERGNAVIAGHLDGEHGAAGVFTNLDKLKEGDKLYIEDGTGTSIAFVVRERRIYNPGYADEVFSQSDSVHLNLITCGGAWDGVIKSYSKRLVVFADITQ